MKNKKKWKDIPVFEKTHQANKKGKIRSKPYKFIRKDGKEYTVKGKQLHPIKQQTGYTQVSLNVNGIVTQISVHRIIGKTFLKNKKNKQYINHKNGIRTDNRVKNLEWCTFSENMKHAYHVLNKKVNLPNYKGKFGIESANAIKIKQLTKERKLIAVFYGGMEAHRATGIHKNSIANALSGYTKTAGGFIWEYADLKKNKN